MGSGDGEATERPWDGGRDGRPAPRRPAPRSTRWYAVGAVGLLVLLVGVWQPAWSGIPYGAEVGIVFAVAGGVLAVVGFTLGPRERAVERKRGSLEGLPGVEVFDPHAPPPDEDDDLPR